MRVKVKEMEQSIHTKSKGGLQKSNNKNKAAEKIAIVAAVYLKDLEILLYFNNGEQRIVNFLLLFSKLSGTYIKYNLQENFKKFIVKNGNIYWGKNEDVIFPLPGFTQAFFLKNRKKKSYI